MLHSGNAVRTNSAEIVDIGAQTVGQVSEIHLSIDPEREHQVGEQEFDQINDRLVGLDGSRWSDSQTVLLKARCQ